MISVEELSKAVAPDNPAGEEGDVGSLFHLYEEARKPAGGGMISGALAEEDVSPWSTLHARAVAYLEKSKDIRAVWSLMVADAQDPDADAGALASVLDGLRLCHALMESFWDTVHPVAEGKEKADFSSRVRIVEMFGNDVVLDLLDRSPVIAPGVPGADKETIGSVVRKLAANSVDVPQIQSQLEMSAAQHPAFLEMIEETIGGCLHELDGMAALIKQKAKSSLNVAPMRSRLGLYRKLVSPYVASKPSDEGGPDEDGGPENSAALAAPLMAVGSHADVVRWFDEMIRHLEANEPGSPVNMLLRRARRMVPMTFSELMEELLPGQFDTFKSVLGPATPGASAPSIDTAPPSQPNSVVINSRGDVARGLDQIAKFYESHEPGSFLLMLVRRARRMMEMNFNQLLTELKPGLVEQLQNVIGKL